MGKIELDRLDASIVVVGALNPAILTPDWLCRKELISESDRDAANEALQAHTAQGVIAYTSSWFAMTVTKQKLAAATTKGSSPRLRDLVAGVFTLLPETPATAIGINFDAEYKFHEASDYFRFGDVLAPKTNWHKIFPAEKWSIGTLSLTVEIIQEKRPQGFPEKKPLRNGQITIQPSPRGLGHVSFAINHHFDIEGGGNGADVVKLLMAEWEKYETDTRALLDQLIKYSMEAA